LAAYNKISEMGMGYTHQKVNHSENSKDTETGTYTQTVESQLQKFSQKEHIRFIFQNICGESRLTAWKIL